jgi:hypothetical protein
VISKRLELASLLIPLKDLSMLCVIHHHIEFVTLIIVNDFMQLDQVGMRQFLHDGYLHEYILILALEAHATLWFSKVFLLF